MTYAVMGGGNTGQAIAGYLKLHGEHVRLFTRDATKAQRISEQGLEVKGLYSGDVLVEASTSVERVLSEAQFIIVSTTAQGHASVVRNMQPFLKPNQTIVFFPGYWGALECEQILGAELIDALNLTIAETSAMPFVSLADQAGSVAITKVKHNVLVSSLRKDRSLSPTFMNRFPQLILGETVFETSLNNTNVVIHPPITLFNAARIDASERFQFYPDGASLSSCEFVEKMDQERLAIARQLGVELQSILTILNEFYQADYATLYEALPGLFPSGLGPTKLDYRYLTEDIPFGLVPISELGRIVGVETPYTDSIITTASLLMKRDYRENGVRFEGLSAQDLRQMSAVQHI